MSDSPLAVYLSFREIVEAGRLPDTLRAQIALCLVDDLATPSPTRTASRFQHAVSSGLDPGEIALNRRGLSRDPRIAAALDLARRVARRVEEIDEIVLAPPRAAGWRDDEIAEIIAWVVLHLVDACQTHDAPA
jgi:hypothetical protein